MQNALLMKPLHALAPLPSSVARSHISPLPPEHRALPRAALRQYSQPHHLDSAQFFLRDTGRKLKHLDRGDT
jgi:hypothetical protein